MHWACAALVPGLVSRPKMLIFSIFPLFSLRFRHNINVINLQFRNLELYRQGSKQRIMPYILRIILAQWPKCYLYKYAFLKISSLFSSRWPWNCDTIDAKRQRRRKKTTTTHNVTWLYEFGKLPCVMCSGDSVNAVLPYRNITHWSQQHLWRSQRSSQPKCSGKASLWADCRCDRSSARAR